MSPDADRHILAGRQAVVIEDNENNRVLMTFILEQAGCAVRCAGTGEDGLRLVLEQQPDFVILDIQLPDISGVTVIERLRASRAHAVPVLVATSYAMAGDRERLLAQGCNGYVEKPIEPDSIVSEIAGMLGIPE